LDRFEEISRPCAIAALIEMNEYFGEKSGSLLVNCSTSLIHGMQHLAVLECWSIVYANLQSLPQCYLPFE